MNAKLIIEGKEFDIEILDPKLQELIASKKKTGYERVEDGQNFWRVETGTITPCRDVYGDGDVQYIYDGANYYSNFEVATNNARADKLMRQLRRFAVEHREKTIDYNEGVYEICYDYEGNVLYIEDVNYYKYVGAISFDSYETAQLAIDTFHDELLWYFTEYKDSL